MAGARLPLCLLMLVTQAMSQAAPCPRGMLAVYRLSLNTHWTQEKFPKQYPQWRPTPQWSKTVGYVHSVSSPLFSLGEQVSPGVKQFAETGLTDVLERETVNKTFLDAVLAPPIPVGEGETNTTIFVDTSHTKISVMTKLVPSPDWFIGLDSLDLCSQGSFVESVTTEAFPLDGGTDNGFTFTSPNWATEPPGEVFTITSDYPAHPAGSFNYPHLARLPILAVYSLTKLREYSLEQDFEKTDTKKEYHHVSSTTHKPKSEMINTRDFDSFKYDTVDASTSKDNLIQSNDIIEFIPVEKKVKKTSKYEIVSNDITPEAISLSSPKFSYNNNDFKISRGSKPSKGFRSFSSVSGYHASTSPDNFFKKKYSSEHLRKAEEPVFPSKSKSKLDMMTKSDVYRQIMSHYMSNKEKKEKRKLRRKKRLRKKKHYRHHKKPRDCLVSEWSGWAGCSKTCGIGETVRTRTVTQQPVHGGRHCPSLRDYKWCGSARNCKQGYFSW